MNFRVLDTSDNISIHELDKTAFSDYWNADTFLDELGVDTRRYIGMYVDETLVGYIGLNIIIDECDIIRIAIHKDFQGRGYSKILFRNALDYLKSISVKKIMLEVSNINTTAIALYESIGFKKIFVRPNYYHDGSDAIIYEMNI